MQELVNIDWQITLNHLVSFATSTEGKDSLKTTSPLSNKEEASRHFSIIKEAQNILQSGQRPYMESLDLFPSWFNRLEKEALLRTLELKDIRLFLLETQNLAQILKPLKGDWIKSLKKNLMSAKEPLSSIDHLMTAQGDIRTDASEELYKLHQEKKQLAGKVQNTLDNLVKGHDHDNHLQDKYVTNREGRWVIPVKSGMQHEIEGIIHATSTSKQTVFMEPQQIVPLNNRIKQIQIDIEKEIERLLRQISDYLHGMITDFVTTKATLLEADSFLAKAQFSNVTSSNPVSFSNELIELNELKHPLMVINGEAVIPNTLRLSQKDRVLLLSGPNAGGKTVLLKSFGLASHMARCGLPICASKDSQIPFFEEIFVAVGDSQSVDESLSTFAGHLKVLNEACSAKGPSSLVLIDEICGSTDPDEGAALARGFIHHYAHQKAFSLITSHLGPLKMGWKKDSGVVNGSMNYDTESGKATYEFIRGVPGKSLAFATAKKIGILDSVYDNAKVYLSPAGQKRLQSMEEVEKLKEEISSLKSTLKKEINQAQAQKRELEKMKLDFNKEKEKRLQQEIQQSLKKLREDIKKERVQNIFNSNDDRQKISLDHPQIIKYTDTSEPEYEDVQSFMKAFPPGRLVFVTTLNQDGIIQGEANSKGEIPILSGSMRLLVHWENLKPPKRTQHPLKKGGKNATVEVTIIPKKNEIDLRGKIVTEAIEELEVTLDAAQAAGNERVKVIHGHGSDSLKKAVRAHLSRSVYVSRWQVAQSGEGGDGTTLVYLIND